MLQRLRNRLFGGKRPVNMADNVIDWSVLDNVEQLQEMGEYASKLLEFTPLWSLMRVRIADAFFATGTDDAGAREVIFRRREAVEDIQDALRSIQYAADAAKHESEPR